MYAAFIVAVFLVLGTLLGNVAMKYQARTDDMRAARERVEQTRIAEGLDRYVKEQGSMPATLDGLVSTAGYEDLRSSRNPRQGYVASGTLNDGTWQYRRAATWSVFRRDGGASYRADNACGTGDVATAASWCGENDGVWYRIETRERYADEIAEQRARQQRSLQKFADHWTANQRFPRLANDGASLGVGQMRHLAQMVGYAGNARNCTGVYVWSGIPFDCSALFDVWGNPVGYQYQGDNYIVLASEAPFANGTGQKVLVASTLNIQE